MGITNYKYKLVNIECLPASVYLNLIMEFDSDIEGLLPYVAARLPGCSYIHGTRVINYPEKYHIIVIKPGEITITRVKDDEEARKLCKYWKDFINETERMRDRIEPVYHRKVEIGPLDVFKALPGTNCKECGEPTCMAFAAKVLRREIGIEECKPLFEEVNPEIRRKLLLKLKNAGLLGGSQ